jgi:hypothetical protein
MTVRELIAVLQNMDQDKPIMIAMNQEYVSLVEKNMIVLEDFSRDGDGSDIRVVIDDCAPFN